MAERQPPNTQVLRPQHLAQVGHEGNPVECFIDVVGTLDSPNPFCTVDDNPTLCTDRGGPVTYPPGGFGGGGGSAGGAPQLPMSGNGTRIQCIQDGESATASLTVTGGVGPYTWSTTAGVITVGNPSNTATLSMATNAGASELPFNVAYGKCAMYCCVFTSCSCKGWNCAGTLVQDCAATNCNDICGATGRSCSCSSCTGCANLDCCITLGSCGGGAQCISCCDVNRAGEGCECLNGHGAFADMRSISGQTSACQPCAIQFKDGAVITVTDSEGTSISFTVTQDYTEV